MNMDKLNAVVEKYDGLLEEVVGGLKISFETRSKAIEASREIGRIHKGPLKGPDSDNSLHLMSMKTAYGLSR